MGIRGIPTELLLCKVDRAFEVFLWCGGGGGKPYLRPPIAHHSEPGRYFVGDEVFRFRQSAAEM